jgi:Clostripain family
MRSSVARLGLLTGFALFAPIALAQTPPAPTPGAPTLEKESEKKEDLLVAPKDFKIKTELATLEEVFKRRLALLYLKNEKAAREPILKDLDPGSAQSIQQFLDDASTFTNLEYHFVEKMKNCERRLLHRLRADSFQGIEDLLEVVKDKKFPHTAAYSNLLNTVDMNFRYALRKGLITDGEFAKDVGRRLTDETVRVNGTAGHNALDLAKQTWKDTPPDQFPAYWFDPSSGPISYDFGDVPPSPPYPQIDLNKATREELLGIPSLESEAVDGILAYAKKNGFEGPEELRLVKDLPTHLVSPLQTLAVASHQKKQKKWTVMVFLNAANNLEPYGIEDMNEMEKVGSTRDVNVVVELVRYHGREKKPRANSAYFSNPYQERETQFYYGLDNTPGNARYYVLKDEDDVRVQSVVKSNAGPADGGRTESLADFGKWAVENYPAENYALVIWNHGAGWSGVSYDDNSHHGMDLPEVRDGVEQIVAKLQNGKKKLDILDFDACLMATLEVGYELKDCVDYLLASQETEPGDGMPYDDYLQFLVKYPETPAVAFAKSMVDAYVKSYAPKGSQTFQDMSSFSETKSAIRLSRMSDTKAAVEALAQKLDARPALLGEVAEDVVRDTRKFGRLVDLHDFSTRLKERAKDDAELKTACDAVLDGIGYPTDAYKLVNEMVVKRRSPGAVIWGFNDWLSPPRNLAPFVHKSKHAKTPLTGPDEKGNYTAKISFPPMMRDPKSNKYVAVTQIDWRFEDEQEKRVFKDFASTFVTMDFPETSPVIAEGHMVSNNRSRGLSIYFPAYLGFDKEYLKLRFAEGSAWTALCQKFPLKKIENPQPLALLGVNHVTKAEREKLGAIAVREEFGKTLRAYDFAAQWRGDLTSLSKTFDVITDPRPYGEDWLGLSRHWQDGVIVLDNHSGAPNGGNPYSYVASGQSAPVSVGPDGRTVMRFLKQGGNVLLTTPDVARELWETPLYRDTLGLAYGQRWDYSFTFKVEGAGGLAGKTIEITPSRKGESIMTFTAASRGDGVEPLAVLEPGGRWIGATIDRTDPETGKDYRAVVLGFYLADIRNDADRRALLAHALEFLQAKREVRGDLGKVDSIPAIPTIPAPAPGSGSQD